MTPVLMQFLTSTGDPIGFANVEIRLTRSDFEEQESGIIMPRLINVVTGLDGKVLVPLMPCSTRYHVTVYDTVSDAALHYHFYVPHLNTPGTIVRLQDLIVADDAVIDPVSYDVTAMLTILDAKANVLAAISRGELARDRAEAAAQFADDSIEATTDARNAAQTAALQVQEDAAQVAIDKQNVHDNALLVEDRAAVALQSKVDVLAAAAASLASATAASNSANAAADSAYEADQSKATAIAARDATTDSLASANTARDVAISARDVTVTAQDITLTARDVATAARDTAVTKADQLASQLHAFNEIYLGKFAVAPMLDGNGNTLKVGAIYENTIEGKIYQWESDLAWHAYDEESQLQLNNATLAASNAAASAALALALKNAAADSATAAANSATVTAGLVTAAADSASASLASQNMAAQSVVDANEAKLTAIDAKDTATAKAAEAASYAAQAINGVLSTVLGGLSTASSAVVSATDTIIAAFGKLQAQLSLKAPLESPTFTGTVKGITKAMVGLNSADNTADVDKPVSMPQATALATKQDSSSKDASGGFAGLTAFKLNLKNATGTILSFLVSGATAARTWTFPDKDGTVAMTSDIPSAATVLNSLSSSNVTTALGFTPLPSTYAPTWSSVTSKPTFAAVATSGSYADLTNTPTPYALPVATATTLGGVKPDGTTITADASGKLSANAAVKPNSGGSLNTQVTYTAGNVTKVVELIGGVSYTTTANYNADGSVASVVVTDGAKVRTETYSYSSGILTGFTATEA